MINDALSFREAAGIRGEVSAEPEGIRRFQERASRAALCAHCRARRDAWQSDVHGQDTAANAATLASPSLGADGLCQQPKAADSWKRCWCVCRSGWYI